MGWVLGQPIVSSQTPSGLGRRKAEPLARAGEGGPLREGQGQRCRRDLLASVPGGWGRCRQVEGLAGDAASPCSERFTFY